MVRLFIYLAVFLFFSCNYKSGKCYDFEIKKGDHSSNGKKKFLSNSNYFTFNISGDVECIPEINGISKIFGFSDGVRHQENSVRLGWLYSEETKNIKFFSYVYRDGKREWAEIGQGYHDVDYNAMVNITKDKYIVVFENARHEYDREKNGSIYKGVLFPYSGGRSPACGGYSVNLCFN